MKVIDLLNKIANGEEVPLVLKYNNKIYEYTKEIDWYLREDLKSELFIDKSRLNDEVEIIDETEKKKIPEKIRTWYSVEVKQSDEENVEYANYNFETMYEKINEIIDYLKSKGDE